VTPGGGRVVDVVFGPAQDRLVVERDAIRFEVPFVEAFVPRVDLETGVVEIVEIEGLIPPTDRD
jgi:ribosomal 30S subunit maturation factor RimM